MVEDVINSRNMLHGGEVMHEYPDTAYSVRSGDKLVSEEVADEAADGQRRDNVFFVSWRRVFDVCDCLARCLLLLKEDDYYYCWNEIHKVRLNGISLL